LRRLAVVALAISAIGSTGVILAQEAPTTQVDQSTPEKPKCIPEQQLRQFYVVAKGMPYSGKRVSTCEKVLPDGQIVKAKRTSYEFRDAEGRTRYEDEDRSNNKVRSITIVDPVEHIQWSFSIGEGQDKTAVWWKYDPRHDSRVYPTTYQTLPGGQSNRRVMARPLQAEGPGYRDEELTSTYVNGVFCEGSRYIERNMPGRGNNRSDHEEIAVTEEWWSEDLFTQVRRKVDDPSLGKYRTNPIDIDRADPDPALFRAPGDYQLLESHPYTPERQSSPLIVIPANPQNAPAVLN
jgi:hypothetical protein